MVIINKVELLGRFCKDFELKYAPGSGIAVTKNVLAVNRKFKKDGGERESDFIPVTFFGKTAEFATQYFGKGRQAAIVGKIQTGSYTDKDGKKVFTTDVIADEIDFADSKQSGQGQNYTPPNNQNNDFPDGDIGFSLSEEDEKNLPF